MGKNQTEIIPVINSSEAAMSHKNRTRIHLNKHIPRPTAFPDHPFFFFAGDFEYQATHTSLIILFVAAAFNKNH